MTVESIFFRSGFFFGKALSTEPVSYLEGLRAPLAARYVYFALIYYIHEVEPPPSNGGTLGIHEDLD